MNAAMNLRVPQNSANFLTSSGPDSFLGRTPLHEVSYGVLANELSCKEKMNKFKRRKYFGHETGTGCTAERISFRTNKQFILFKPEDKLLNPR